MTELKDIVQSIYRYNALHKQGQFIFRFVGYKKDKEHQCIECGDNCDCYDDSKSLIGAYGNLEDLRAMLNDLRDIIEDIVDENDFVNFNEFGEN